MPLASRSRKVLRIVATGATGAMIASSSLAAQVIGSTAEDRARLDEILGRRAVCQLAPCARHDSVARGLRSYLVWPDVRVVWNSAIPFSLNDGSLWAGRGLNASITAGAGAEYDRQDWGLTLVFAPTFAYSANRPFDFFPDTIPGRSPYSSPWHTGGAAGSADLPLRFGNASLHVIDLGYSELAARFHNASFGFSNTPQWWGPGIRNALVMSDNAPSIPRAFVRTAAPIGTRFGSIAAEIEAGTLTESLFFDSLSTNNYRSFSALTATYEAPGDLHLVLGLSRAVYAPEQNAMPGVSASLNALRWRPTGAAGVPLDQISSVFARWWFPESGFEAYGEYARMDVPRSLSDFLQTPYRNGGYTVGLQWAGRPDRLTGLLRLESEVSTVEQNLVDRSDLPADFYTGKLAPQGYTQRGQIMGAAVGPGGSSQFVGVDYLPERWQAGLFVGRIRWEDNAMYRQRYSTFFSHDVSIYSGVRGGYRLPRVDVSFELTAARRFNYLFQNGFSNPQQRGTVRVQNITFETRLTPR